MDILLGVGTLSATVVLFCWSYGAHRRADRAKWVSWPGASMLVCVAMTLMLPVGIGFLIQGALHPLADIMRIDILSLLVTTSVVALACVMSPVLLAPARRKTAALPASADNNNFAPAALTRAA